MFLRQPTMYIVWIQTPWWLARSRVLYHVYCVGSNTLVWDDKRRQLRLHPIFMIIVTDMLWRFFTINSRWVGRVLVGGQRRPWMTGTLQPPCFLCLFPPETNIVFHIEVGLLLSRRMGIWPCANSNQRCVGTPLLIWNCCWYVFFSMSSGVIIRIIWMRRSKVSTR